MQITAEDIQKITLSEEAIKDLIESKKQELDYKASEELMIAATEANKDIQGELDKMSRYDKINWLCRTTYLIGYLEALTLANEAFKLLLADFVGGGVRNKPFSLQAVTDKIKRSEGVL